MECPECLASPEYPELRVSREEMVSMERRAASESGDHKALLECQGKLDHGALKVQRGGGEERRNR